MFLARLTRSVPGEYVLVKAPRNAVSLIPWYQLRIFSSPLQLNKHQLTSQLSVTRDPLHANGTLTKKTSLVVRGLCLALRSSEFEPTSVTQSRQGLTPDDVTIPSVAFSVLENSKSAIVPSTLILSIFPPNFLGSFHSTKPIEFPALAL